MPELQPKMRDALLAAFRTPSRSLKRACGGFIAMGAAPIRTSGPAMYQAFTRRTLNRLADADLVRFDEPEFPSTITLTDEGVRLAAELAQAGAK